MLTLLFEKRPFVGVFVVKRDFLMGDAMEIYMCDGMIRTIQNKPIRHDVAVVGLRIDKSYNPFWEYLESDTPFTSAYSKDGFNPVIVIGFDKAYLLHI